MSQSPIYLQAADSLPLAKPSLLFECQYKPGKVNGCFAGHPGHANFVVHGPGPVVRFRGASYELKKIHIHSKSEHIVEQDDPHDYEFHLVHAPLGSPVASPLVVIGILFKRAGKVEKSNKTIAAIGDLLNSAESQVCVTIDPLDLFSRNSKGKPDTTEWFHYEGSLTGYPYSEIVSWIVMKNTASISESLIQQFKQHAKQHPRELQPLDRRLVVRSFLEGKENS